ncbi:MAG: nitrous oxide reductase family maturation protein NosD [Campylobacteraceae bacterium]|jgi:nitrous oxidase accessory protein|nr:nitrous oxide reductase family maturation protein NosD [Campylobacteraceae bacterium]
MRYLTFLLLAPLLFSNPLQEAIDNAPSGSKIELGKGEFKGRIVINKPLIIEGVEDKSAHIIGDNTGSVITITSSNVILRNLWISGSGSSHEGLDAAILAKEANNVLLEGNKITDSLFGINFQKVSNSKIINNFITSKPYDLGVRGDGIVFWYSHGNTVRGNHLQKSRDMVAWYSSKNVYEDNFGEYGRYSLHFMYANDNLVQNNIFEHNSVGIFFMYSHDIIARNNTMKNSLGTFGLGLGLKDSSNFIIEDNNIIYNARGVFLDQSPYQQDSVNIFKRNKILYNASAVQFLGLREKSLFSENIFKGNMELISSDMPKNDMPYVEWRRNYWDDYEGFDMDKDGVGDIPYKQYAYADKLWLYNTDIKFFYGTAAMGLLNFLAKLAPFSEPELMVADNEPLIKAAM